MAGYIGSKAVNLSTTGADINGDANIDGDLSFRDNDKAIFGAGSDLQIYHDGTHSYLLENGTGNLRINTDNQVQIRKHNNEAIAYFNADGGVQLYHDNSRKFDTTSTGVDITGTLTSDGLTVNSGTNNTVAKFESSDAGAFIILEDSGSTNDGNRIAVEGDVMSFATGDSEAMRIDASGNLLVGNTSTILDSEENEEQGVDIRPEGFVKISRSANHPLQLARTNDGELIKFRSNEVTVGSIGTTSSRLYTGTGDTGLFFNDQLDSIDPWNTSTNAARDAAIDLGDGSRRFKDLYLSGGIKIVSPDTTSAAAITFGDSADASTGSVGYFNSDDSLRFSGYNNSEAMRIDSSGNLLVGKTSDDNTNAGLVVNGNGLTKIVRASATANVNDVLQLNRLTTEGDILVFKKDGTEVGSIGVQDDDLWIGEGGVGLQFQNTGNDRVDPFDVANNAVRDNAIDLGGSSSRFDDIYATNGTIQTSDRNEKQDIAELSDAEQRVAVAAKGLLRKFRWRDAVEAKGDEARTHFGIIAQDLQAAFAAEGLDAGDYAMFISSTWTDENTGEERTRMGVRYSELLAFIIGAL